LKLRTSYVKDVGKYTPTNKVKNLLCPEGERTNSAATVGGPNPGGLLQHRMCYLCKEFWLNCRVDPQKNCPSCFTGKNTHQNNPGPIRDLLEKYQLRVIAVRRGEQNCTSWK
jgi:hypothetical protein